MVAKFAEFSSLTLGCLGINLWWSTLNTMQMINWACVDE